MDQSEGLKRNIVLYYFFRTFGKRAYFPLVVIYAVSVADLTLAQFGVIASLAAIVSFVTELPSGYISDRMGHKQALILGYGIIMLAPLGYVFWPNFWGVFMGSALFYGGYSFISGTYEAFMYETLTALNRRDEYSKLNGRIQAVSLLGNMVLVASVPLTYSIDPRMPFLIGAFLLGINFVLSFFLVVPPSIEKVSESENLDLRRLFSSIWSSYTPILFFVLGIAGAASDKALELKEVYLQSFNIPISWLGIIAAGMSIFAALVSYNIYLIEKYFSSRQYYAFNFIVTFTLFIIAGLTKSFLIGLFCLAVLVAYDRSEGALSKSYILRDCPAPNLKATYISMLTFIQAFCGIWIPLFLGYLSDLYGIRGGYLWFAVSLLSISAVLFWIYSLLRRRANFV